MVPCWGPFLAAVWLLAWLLQQHVRAGRPHARPADQRRVVWLRWVRSAPYPGANASLLSELGQKHSDGIITSCLRRRSSWRKDSCGDFCRIHLSTPVLLASYYMTMLFSRVTRYNDPVLRAFACYLPVPLGFCIIGLQLALDRTGGIVGSLSILSVMLESYYLGPNPPWESEVFWSYHRFLLAALAVWAAVTHQARDVYLVGSYTLLAFFAGFMAYTVSLIKQGNPKAHSGTICLHLYIGISAIVACFVLLLQQHWYLSSPMWSSVVSPWPSWWASVSASPRLPLAGSLCLLT